LPNRAQEPLLLVGMKRDIERTRRVSIDNAKGQIRTSPLGLSVPLRSSNFRVFAHAGEFLEKALGPGMILVTGGLAYLDDLKERSEGSCEPFGWEKAF